MKEKTKMRQVFERRTRENVANSYTVETTLLMPAATTVTANFRTIGTDNPVVGGRTGFDLFVNTFSPKKDPPIHVRFTLREAALVELWILAKNGELVKEVKNADPQTNSYLEPWDGQNMDGAFVASRNCFLRLEMKRRMADKDLKERLW